MKKLWIILNLLPLSMMGQVADDFSDGDFTQNPSWTGDLGHFRVSASTAVPEAQRPAVQLNAPEAGRSALAVACALDGNLEWQFWIKLSLNTSSGNFARVYMLSDTVSLKVPLSGYFLQFGGDTDSVDFCRQDSIEVTHLLRLQALFTGNSTNTIRLKITRDFNGNWEFAGDPAGNASFQPVGETTDKTHISGSHFGFLFQYTGSNTSKFYFDDIYAGPLIVDTIPPAVSSVSVINSDEISIKFDEPVELSSAENVFNYQLMPGTGNPYEAIRMLDVEEVHLFFDPVLGNGIKYALIINNIEDISGNISGTVSWDVMFYTPSPFDIIFTEIMADPSPPAGLPEFEYLEIFNRSAVEVDLGNWKLCIGSSEHDLPEMTIRAGEYLILCSEEAVDALQEFGRVIGFSSFSLSNSGTSLSLNDKNDRNVCYLDYDPSWYRDDLNADGGYSLEITDVNNPCLGSANWRASGHPAGGTPGRLNFNAGAIEDEFRIAGICCLTDTILQVTFGSAMDSLAAADVSRYHIDGVQGILAAKPIPPDFRKVRISLARRESTGQIHHLTIDPGILNCIGNIHPDELDAEFGWPKACRPFDIIINEILFNPLGEGVDYVEIFNRSDHAVMLEAVDLASVRETPPNPPDTQRVRLIKECQSLLPGHFLVLSRKPEVVKSQYYTPDPYAFLEMSSFPYFNDDAGEALLFQNDTVIDGMRYREEMHFIMLGTLDGVSLERISPDRLGDDPGNWHSAAATVGFGTPGYRNSQYLGQSDQNGSFNLDPDSFSPDGDGKDDQLGIYYSFSKPGKLMTILVFSSEGFLTKTLVNNEMPGTSGIFSWDGTMDDRTPAPDGIYLVYMEALDMTGKTTCYKKACVLARRR